MLEHNHRGSSQDNIKTPGVLCFYIVCRLLTCYIENGLYHVSHGEYTVWLFDRRYKKQTKNNTLFFCRKSHSCMDVSMLKLLYQQFNLIEYNKK